MSRLKFALTSDQLELLLAFAKADGLTELANTMAKDPSVVSRNLQRIAETSAVLEKVKGRWELTELGHRVNQQTQFFLEKQNEILGPMSTSKTTSKSNFSKLSTLIIINAQNGLFGLPPNEDLPSKAESNIVSLLKHWRLQNRPVIYVKQASEKASSRFFRHGSGFEILKSLTPMQGEAVLEKTKSSAFLETELELQLEKYKSDHIVLVGFTANECIDATARDSAALGFTTFVVGDATATFDLLDPNGKLVKAEKVHKMTLAHINAFYAKVISTDEIIF